MEAASQKWVRLGEATDVKGSWEKEHGDGRDEGENLRRARKSKREKRVGQEGGRGKGV